LVPPPIVVIPRGYKSRWSLLRTPASSHTVRHSHITSFRAPIKKEREREKRKGERKKKERGVLPDFRECCFSFPFQPWRNKTGLPPSSHRVTCKASELTACCTPEDPTSPAPVEGYVVTFVALYEWGFGAPSHRFLHLLLWHYGLELHHLTPSGVLHITTFVTLCEAYLGIDPQFDLWNYFFRVQHLQDPDAELTISGVTVIHVKFGHGVDPYFDIPIPRSMKG
jgi:hypothetical protein